MPHDSNHYQNQDLKKKRISCIKLYKIVNKICHSSRNRYIGYDIKDIKFEAYDLKCIFQTSSLVFFIECFDLAFLKPGGSEGFLSI